MCCLEHQRTIFFFPPFRSIGVLTYVMLTGSSPFLGDNKQETFLNISQGNADYSQDVFEGVSSLAIDFIKTLLVQDPRSASSAVCFESGICFFFFFSPLEKIA